MNGRKDVKRKHENEDAGGGKRGKVAGQTKDEIQAEGKAAGQERRKRKEDEEGIQGAERKTGSRKETKCKKGD
jgi:hypothetical protein